MQAIAGPHRLWRRLAPDRALYYRFFNRRKLALPADLVPAVEALAGHRYDPETRRGVLFASPFRFDADGETRRPDKPAVIFVAGDPRKALELEGWFRTRFEV